MEKINELIHEWNGLQINPPANLSRFDVIQKETQILAELHQMKLTYPPNEMTNGKGGHSMLGIPILDEIKNRNEILTMLLRH